MAVSPEPIDMYPERKRLKDALLRMVTDAGGQIHFSHDRVATRLAGEFGLSESERNAPYGNGLNKWEQDIRMMHQALLKEGFFIRGPRGFWVLSPEGMNIGRQLLDDFCEQGDPADGEATQTDDPPRGVAVLEEEAMPNNSGERAPGSFAIEDYCPAEALPAAAQGLSEEVPPVESIKTISVPATVVRASVRESFEQTGFGVREKEGRLLEISASMPGRPLFRAHVWIDGESETRRLPSSLPLIALAHRGRHESLLLPDDAIELSVETLLRVSSAEPPLGALVDALERSRGRAVDEDWLQAIPVPLARMEVSLSLLSFLMGYGRLRAQHDQCEAYTADEAFWTLFGDERSRPMLRRADLDYALSLLSNPLVGALVPTDGRYVVTAHASQAATRLSALSGLLGSNPRS